MQANKCYKWPMSWFLATVFIGMLACSSSFAQYTDIYWTGAGDNSWSNTNNWDLQRLPDTNDIVRLGYAADGASLPIADAAQNIDLDLAGVQIYRLVIESTGNRAVTLTSAAAHPLILLETGPAGTFAPVQMTSNATASAVLDVVMDVSTVSTTHAPQLRNDSPSAVLTVGPTVGIFDTGGGVTGNDPVTYQTGIGTVRWHRIYQNFRAGHPSELSLSRTTIFDGVGGRSLLPYPNSDLRLAGNATFWTFAPSSGGTTTVSVIESDAVERTFYMTYYIAGSSTAVIQVIPSPDGSTGTLLIRIRQVTWVFLRNSAEIATIPGTTVEFLTSASTHTNAIFGWAPNNGISGGGDVWFNRTHGGIDNLLHLERSLTYTGRTMLQSGTVRLTAYETGGNTYYGYLPTNTIVEISSAARFDLNGIDQTVGGLTGFRGRLLDQVETFGEVVLDGATLTVNSISNTTFGGSISGTGTLVKCGTETLALTPGYTNIADRALIIDDGRWVSGGGMDITQGDFKLTGGYVETASLAASGTVWDVTISTNYAGAIMVDAGNSADITDATLQLAIADDYLPASGVEFIILNAINISGVTPAGNVFQYTAGRAFEVDGVWFRVRIDESGGRQAIILQVIPPIASGSVIIVR